MRCRPLCFRKLTKITKGRGGSIVRQRKFLKLVDFESTKSGIPFSRLVGFYANHALIFADNDKNRPRQKAISQYIGEFIFHKLRVSPLTLKLIFLEVLGLLIDASRVRRISCKRSLVCFRS